MASETSDRGESTYQSDSGAQTNPQDVYFASAHHDHSEDDLFGGGQSMDAQNQQPQQVPVPQGESVIRVQVTPGEILELAPPFTPDANMVAREADGNLAIKVGDVTVILEGFIDANNTAPVVVESSDGKPIDVATVIAQTDPAIDIQTAAGPAAGPQGGQGADNTGAILAQLAGGAGLGGLNAVGAQDGTSLSYSTIDNSIIQDRFLAAGVLGGTAPFSGLSEPFLRDPMHVSNFSDFNSFFSSYKAFVNGSPGDGWADFTGTQATDTDFDDFIAKTSFSSVVSHGGGTGDQIFLDPPELSGWTSNGQPLEVDMVHSTDDTIFIQRAGDHALVMVIHVHTQGDLDGTGNFGPGNYQVDTFLINRIDHPDHGDGVTTDSVQDILTLNIPYEIFSPGQGEGSEEGTFTHGSTTVQVQDDVPVAHDVTYTSYLGNDNPTDGEGGVTLASKGGSHDTTVTSDFGSVDEDWLKGDWWQHNQGNKDQDNDPSGANSDPAHGDDLGRTSVTGSLDIDFGADGPAGAGGNDLLFEKPSLSGLGGAGDPTDPTTALALNNVPDVGKPFLDANGHEMTSDGHTLVVLEHTTLNGVDHLVVGYTTGGGHEEPPSEIVTESVSAGGQCVNVFELDLNTNPDDHSGNSQFQDFKFELFKGIDQDNNPNGAEPTESNTNLHFDVIGHDDDGDAVHTGINIHVNDDVPTVKDSHYLSFVGGTEVSESTALAMLGIGHGSGVTITTDTGYVDEDWLKGGGANDHIAGQAGNQDEDGSGHSNAGANGDDVGKTKVFGLLDVDFGGDGPTTQQAAFSLLGSNVVGQQFKDADGQTFTSGGGVHDLIVLSATDGHLAVGYHDDAANADVTVFTLDLGTDAGNWDFGGFAFTLTGAMDHPDKGTEDNLNIHFDVTATDADFDTAHAAINIQVNDDQPEAAVTYYNTLPEGPSEGGTLAALAGTSGGYTGAGQIDEDWLANGNGDEDANGHDNSNKNGDQPGFATVYGSIDIKYGADGPSGDTSAFVLAGAEGDQVQAKQGSGQIIDLKTADGGHEVHLHLDNSVAGHQVLIGYANADDSNGFQDGSSTEVFKLDLDTTSGDFTFTLEQALDHPIINTEDNLKLIFGLGGGGTDKDGDPAIGAITISVNDDKPEVAITYGTKPEEDVVASVAPTAAADYGQIDEDWLTNPPNHDNGNQDADNNTGDKPGTASISGQVTVLWGADGPADDNAYSLTDGDGKAKAQDGSGHMIDLKTDDGRQVYLHNGNDGTLIGFTNASPSDHTYHAGSSTEVFSLALDQNGSFTFTLEQAVQHPIVNTEDNLTLLFGVAAGADNDGDQAIGTIKIKINDDAPQAVDDYDTHSLYSGNVITDPTTGDLLGADGATLTQIKHGSHSVNVDQHGGDTKIDGDWGTLTIHDDGSWSYVQTKFTTDGSKADVFAYTLTDGDGDQSKANLTIDVRATPVAVDDNIYTNITGPVAVKDAWLLANDTDADSDHSLLTITNAVAGAGQSTFFDAGPTHSGTDVNFNLDVGILPGKVHIGDSTSFDYTMQDPDNLSDGATATIHYAAAIPFIDPLLPVVGSIHGSSGDDIMIGHDVGLQGGAGNDLIFGTGTHDAIDFAETTGPWSFTLGEGGAGTADVNGHDTYGGIANVVGGSGDNQITGNSSDNVLAGGDGSDTLTGGGGHDTLLGDGGNDVMTYDSDDHFYGGSGFDTVQFNGDAAVTRNSLAGDFHDVELLSLGKGGDADNVTIGTASEGVRVSDVIGATTYVGGIYSLYVSGDSGDQVNVKTGGFNGFTDKGLDTTNSNSADSIPDGTYHHYQASALGITVNLYVDEHVQTTNTAS
jgi:T1SS-143 domain-containing protein